MDRTCSLAQLIAALNSVESRCEDDGKHAPPAAGRERGAYILVKRASERGVGGEQLDAVSRVLHRDRRHLRRMDAARLLLDPAARLPASSQLHNNISSPCCDAAAPAADIATLCNLLALLLLLLLPLHPSRSSGSNNRQKVMCRQLWFYAFAHTRPAEHAS